MRSSRGEAQQVPVAEEGRLDKPHQHPRGVPKVLTFCVMPELRGALFGRTSRLRCARLARECAKLDTAVEQAAAEEALESEAQWPEHWATVAE